MNQLAPLLLAAASAALLAPSARAQEAEAKKESEQGLTLERLFPEKGLFGRPPRGMEFSHDGRFAAWFWHPYVERRHGSDLYVLDVESGEITRRTKVSVMAEFQKSTRKVKEDRIAEAKKAQGKAGRVAADQGAKAGENGNGGGGNGPDAELTGDEVGEGDHGREKAPRYSGISSFEWSPTAHELLFTSEGDVYRLRLAPPEGEPAIERLTRSRDGERSVQYVPDGSGYTYMRDDALIRVRFGSHRIEQIDPDLPSGERLVGHELSPDGNAIALLTQKGGSWRDGSRRVQIISYRDRFARVREVPRSVSDDPLPKQEWSIYLYRVTDPMLENGKLTRVFHHEVSGPRDILRTPEWSPDSQRVAFAVFEQKSELVRVLVAELDAKPTKAAPENAAADKAAAADKSGEDDEESRARAAASRSGDGPAVAEAKVVHRFLHAGGPNTPTMIRPQFLADSKRLVMVTEQSGFRQLFRYDPLWEHMEQLTSGRFEVYPIDLSKDRSRMWVTATRDDSAREQVYAVSLDDGAMQRMNVREGTWSNVAVSPGGTVVLGDFVTYGELSELAMVKDGEQKVLSDSHPPAAKELVTVKPEFFTFENRHGHQLRGHMFKPGDWSKGDQRPLLLYVYGGPLGTRKTVQDGSYSAASYLFARYMTEKHGWVTCSIDPRGQSGYGALFEKANFEQVGRPQTEDIVDCVKWFIAEHGVDAKRVAMHGWSFGGFQTQMCMYTEPDVFAAGIAGAGPTEWENYNAWYSQGTIGDTEVGKADLKKFSLLPLAKNLEGRLLLVHGMEDPNVLYQDTVRVYRELLKAGKETLVELFLDPTGGHGLGGDVKALGRYRKYEDFLLRYLGKGNARRRVY